MPIFLNVWSRYARRRGSLRSMRGCCGFSLIELLVVIAIISILASVVLVRYRSFDSQLLLRNLGYEIALSIRDAQVRGISVSGVGGSFTAAYGMHFDMANPRTYVLFVDTNKDGYTLGEEVSTYTIGQNKQISGLCTVSGSFLCVATGTLDIVFQRPNPDAVFYIGGLVAARSYGTIRLQSSEGNTREVNIWSTGQIEVR